MENNLFLTTQEKKYLQDCIPNQKTYDNLSWFFQSFSDNTRLKILSLLSIQNLLVGDIAEVLDQNQTTISHQLKTLKDAGLVECHRKGKNIEYKIKNKNFINILNTLVDYACDIRKICEI